LAEQLCLPKSTLHNHLRAQKRRHQHPESAFWETKEGSEWLSRLVFATLYQFGLKSEIGAGQLSEFFQLIRIHTHVGISENALRQQLKEMEGLFVTYQQQCESSATAPVSARTVAMDETFFQQMMILVMMDLPSGYVFVETVAADRSFETWKAAVIPRLETLGLTVRPAISDRAKALIKLALNALDCESGADLFHAQQDLGRWLSAPLARQTKKAAAYQKDAQTLLAREETRKTEQRDFSETGRLQAHVAEAEKQHAACLAAQKTYKAHREAISHSIHPFNLSSSLHQDEAAILKTLQQESDALAALANTAKINDPKDKLGKFRRQHKALSQHVSIWWLWIHTLLDDLNTDQLTQDWVTTRLMPVVYWSHRATQTKKPSDRTAYRNAWEKAVKTFDDDAFTKSLSSDVTQYWLAWCEETVTHFQRTSSAVEGRNGCLAQMYHNRRGLTEARLKALTVIHNYGTFRTDGSTPASRLYGQEFPDLFESLLGKMGPLPLPRRSRVKKKANPLIYKKCPSLSG